MESNINIKEIEQYLEGQLSGKALEDFEQQLKEDTILAARVEMLKELDHAIADEEALKVQQTIQDLGTEFFNSGSAEEDIATVRRLPFYRRPLAIAATILLLVAVGFIIQMQIGKTLSNQELYAAYYSPYEANELRRGDAPLTNLYSQAIQKYSTGDLQGAIADFNQFLTDNPQDVQAQFALAHAYLNKNPSDPGQAADHFRQVIRDGKSVLVPKAKWYLALIYLEQDNTSNAKALLKELAGQADDENLAARAGELLGKMK